MAEYIERKAVLAHLEERREYLFKENGDYDHYTNGFDEAVDRVENFPVAADVVEVVRCKDCKYHRIMENKKNFTWWHNCELWCVDIVEDDFCSYGERRSDND